MISVILLIILGLVAGVMSGLVGIGGGVILVPALVIFFGLSQHQAQGTTLALFAAPIGLLAAFTYYRQGYVDIKTAIFIFVGFVIGGLIGSRFAFGISDQMLSKLFASTLLVIALKMLFFA